MELGQLALNLIINLLASVIYDGVNFTSLPFFQRRKIERRIEDSVADVVEPLLPFLTHEKISEEKQRKLIVTCVEELSPLTKDSKLLFQGSLNGQKIFEDMYENRALPRVIIEDDLRDIYTLLFPRIATLLCKIPMAVKDWESEAWSENYKRLDEITTELHRLFGVVDELATSASKEADEVLSIVRRSLAQKVRLELDLTGLRADRPLAGNFDDFFVHPEIVKDDKKTIQVIGSPENSFTVFTASNRKSYVVGPAGAGKSTLAKWLQRETLTDRWTGISVRIELRRYTNQLLPPLHDMVREAAGKHFAEDISSERIGTWLKAKNIIFILDGFDEVPLNERDEFLDWILELTRASRGCSFILTSRPLTTNHLERLKEDNWQGWIIQPFDEQRIIDYIRRWYSYAPLLPDENRDIDAESLAFDWQNDPTIEPLTSNPLLLSTLLMVHHLDGRLPNGRSELYKRYVEGMLGLWDDRRKVSVTTAQLTLQQKRQIIRGFALKLFFEEHEQLDESIVYEWLQDFLHKEMILVSASEILDVLRERSGLILGPGIYSFAHKSIAEYFVAEAILQGDQRDFVGVRIDRFRLFEHRDDDRWNTVIFLWAGMAPSLDVESFIEGCLEAKNWALGFGILNDQYERISVDYRRRILTEFINQDGLVETPNIVWWSVSHAEKPSEKRLWVPSFELRGLLPINLFSDLIFKATKDRLIVWSDYFNAKGKWRDLLWMCFAIKISDFEIWEECLMSPYPNEGTPLDWLYLVCESVFLRALTRESVGKNIEVVLARFQDIVPHARGLIPVSLMSIALVNTMRTSDKTNPEAIEMLDKIIEILPDCDRGEVLPSWLVKTQDWVLVWDENKKHSCDLLLEFQEKIIELSDLGYIKQKGMFESTMDYVEELLRNRNSIDAGVE